ncbi:MAG: methyltransferase [Candidatus Marinimicrobia bacterium]|nr:methyltransferase [Candidatus Neomarinimicrobiota bacterium]
MDDKTFEELRKIVYNLSGIRLTDQKKALVSARLNKRLRALRIDSYNDYLEYLINDREGNEIIQMIDVITTNVTSFFREADHFDFLKEIMISWVNSGYRRFRIWSAGCSTGEETYSIAFTILNSIPTYADMDLRILGSDISTDVINRAKKGEYDEEKMRNVPYNYQKRFFIRTIENGQVKYKVTDFVKNYIIFRRLNLSYFPLPLKGPLDVIFCRNVMIYFGSSIRESLVRELYRLLKPGGYLFLGHSESIIGMEVGFKVVKPSVYLKPSVEKDEE